MSGIAEKLNGLRFRPGQETIYRYRNRLMMLGIPPLALCLLVRDGFGVQNGIVDLLMFLASAWFVGMLLMMAFELLRFFKDGSGSNS